MFRNETFTLLVFLTRWQVRLTKQNGGYARGRIDPNDVGTPWNFLTSEKINIGTSKVKQHPINVEAENYKAKWLTHLKGMDRRLPNLHFKANQKYMKHRKQK